MDFIDIVASLIVLIILEIILGIDNLVILSILSEKLPLQQRKKARRLGLTLSWVMRLMLLAFAIDIIKWTQPIVTLFEMSFSYRDFFLILGGAFLLWKSTDEIHQEMTDDLRDNKKRGPIKAKFSIVVMQIILMDVIFSLDSVLTAVGLTSRFWIMAFAITCAILIMIFASEIVSAFIKKHPTIKMLALSYLILIGTVLIADGFSFYIPRGYLYVSMGFSLAVESLNLIKRSQKKSKKRLGN